MCTVTWRFASDGSFDLLSNRDERRTRRPASLPRRFCRDGLSFLAPLDGDAGGSWIGVNEHGLAMTLLNLYELESKVEPPAQPVSRGLLLLDLLTQRRASDVATAIGKRELGCFRPFVLLALSPGATALVVRWNGERHDLAERGEYGLLSSSGHDAAAAEAARTALLGRMAAAAGGLDVAVLECFHRSHRPRRGPLSPCMHRPEATTVSFSHVRVTNDRVSMAYAPGAPCRTRPGPELGLQRAPV